MTPRRRSTRPRIPVVNVEFVGREEIRAGIERLAEGLWGYLVQTTHPGTIQLEGDTASGRAYVLSFGHMRDGSSHLNYSVYHDRYRRTPKGWKFTERADEIIFSTRQFELPSDRPATFAVDLAVNNIGGDPGDFRRGMAAFHAFDFEVSRRVFAVCGTSTRVFALHEQLGAWGAGEPFYHVVESPYEDFDDDLTRLRACEITLDRSRSTAAWRVDGRRVYETHGTFIPERVQIGFGIWTMLPIRDGRSRSLDGQGMNARWRRFRVRGVDA